MDIGAAEIRRWHREKGWVDIGYHYVIRRDGKLEPGRDEGMVGAHVKGHNEDSIGICLVGGIDDDGESCNNFTQSQHASLIWLIRKLLKTYPGCDVLGHRDLDPHKDCPCFDVRSWWEAQKKRTKFWWWPTWGVR